MHAYEVYAHEVHAREVYAYEMYTYEMHAYEMHAPAQGNNLCLLIARHLRGNFYTIAPSTFAALILSISGFRPKSHPIPSTISTRNFSLDFSIGKKPQKP
jgi:predicted ferric reductase